MKKIFFILPIVFVLLFTFNACEKDESLTPTPSIVAGQFVRFDITSRLMDFNDPNAFFGGIITAPGNNVAKYTLKVKRRNGNVFAADYSVIKEISEFPFELKITPQDFANAVGLPLIDLKENDSYIFTAESIGKDGTVINYNNLSATIKSQPSSKQAYRFYTLFATGANYTSKVNDFDNYTIPN